MSLEGRELLAVLCRLPRGQLLRMRKAGEEAMECMRSLAERGSSVSAELIGRERRPQAWDHYPGGDAIDSVRRFRYYYHCHGKHPPPLAGEHGHFHLFTETGASTQAAGQPPLVHLAAVSVDPRGMPIHVFTTNRWVTGGAWWSARALLRRLAAFRIHARGSSALVDRWLTAMVRLFYPQLRLILELRDARLARLSAVRAENRVLEDRRIHALSYCRISIPWQFEALERALAS